MEVTELMTEPGYNHNVGLHNIVPVCIYFWNNMSPGLGLVWKIIAIGISLCKYLTV